MSSTEKPKEKKKVYYVPSRYKQAAEKVTAQSSSSREKTTFLRTNNNSRGKSRETSNSVDCTKLSITQAGQCEMTSTPTSKGEIIMPLLDASVVSNTKELPVPNLKESIGPMTSCYLKQNLKKNKPKECPVLRGPLVASHVERKVHDQFSDKNAEAYIDILYAKYVQASYLDFQMEETLKKRSDHAVEKIHRLFNLVLFYMNKLQSEQSEAKIVSYFLKVFKHSQKQEEIYKPLLDIMPSLERQYQSLAEAVNATKHKLQVKGILLPEPGSEDRVIQLLEETNNIISEFFLSFTYMREICNAADTMENYVNVAEKISDSLKKGTQLLTEAQDLLLSEASLQLSKVHL